MKSTKSISLLIALLFSASMSGQDKASNLTPYYDFELVQKEVRAPGDTIYEVFLVLDSADIPKDIDIVLSSKDTKREISFEAAGLSESKAVEKKDAKYKIYMQEWSPRESWEVSFRSKDGTCLVLNHAQAASLKEPQRITNKPATTDVLISEKETIGEEEIQSEVNKSKN